MSYVTWAENNQQQHIHRGLVEWNLYAIFVYGQSVEAGVWNRLNKHYTSNLEYTTCDSKCFSLERPWRIQLPQLFLILFLYCFQNACYKYKKQFRKLYVNIMQYFRQ